MCTLISKCCNHYGHWDLHLQKLLKFKFKFCCTLAEKNKTILRCQHRAVSMSNWISAVRHGSLCQFRKFILYLLNPFENWDAMWMEHVYLQHYSGNQLIIFLWPISEHRQMLPINKYQSINQCIILYFKYTVISFSYLLMNYTVLWPIYQMTTWKRKDHILQPISFAASQRER